MNAGEGCREVSNVAPRTLTVLAAIRPGEEEPLRDVLRPIGDDVKGKRLEPGTVRPRIEFRHSRRIHFARFAILDDPDRGRDRKRLLYSANYDGELDSHLAELIAITSDMDAIWGRVEGYTGAAAFAAFIRAHTQEPEAFYIAFRDETVERLHDAIAFRRRAQTLVDEASSASLAALLPRLSSGAPAWATGRALQSHVLRRSSGCSARFPSSPTCSGRSRGAASATSFAARSASSPASTAIRCSAG